MWLYNNFRKSDAMNVNFFPFSNSLQILGRRQSLANIMCNQQSVTQSRKKDLFVRNTMYDTGIYTASAGKRNKMISNSILSADRKSVV